MSIEGTSEELLYSFATEVVLKILVFSSIIIFMQNFKFARECIIEINNGKKRRKIEIWSYRIKMNRKKFLIIICSWFAVLLIFIDYEFGLFKYLKGSIV